MQTLSIQTGRRQPSALSEGQQIHLTRPKPGGACRAVSPGWGTCFQGRGQRWAGSRQLGGQFLSCHHAAEQEAKMQGGILPCGGTRW